MIITTASLRVSEKTDQLANEIFCNGTLSIINYSVEISILICKMFLVQLITSADLQLMLQSSFQYHGYDTPVLQHYFYGKHAHSGTMRHDSQLLRNALGLTRRLHFKPTLGQSLCKDLK